MSSNAFLIESVLLFLYKIDTYVKRDNISFATKYPLLNETGVSYSLVTEKNPISACRWPKLLTNTGLCLPDRKGRRDCRAFTA